MINLKIAIAIVGILAILLVTRLVTKHVARLGERKEVLPYRVAYISKTLNILATVAILLLIMLMLGIEYAQAWVVFTSVFAVIGVALFAQWSMLSNITASVIIFFFFPYRVGDHVKVVDKDEDIRGVIKEITLFHVVIRRDSETITYPNSLILQKAVIKGPVRVASGAVTMTSGKEAAADPNKQIPDPLDPLD